MRLYLASTSPARLATLRSAGIEPAGLISPGVDEDAVVAAMPPHTPQQMVLELARAKASAVIGQLVDGEPIDGFILGGDSAFELDGEIFGKPHTADVARSRWARMVGSTGVLHSGHWLIDHRGGSVQGSAGGIVCSGVGAVESARVSFADDISAAEIDAYVATGEPLQVAGAFTIDGRGAAFISGISGTPSAVIGLSVPTLRELLHNGFGVEFHHFWNH